MGRIRIVLVGMPRILRDVIMSIVADQPDMEIVGEVPVDASPSVVEDLAASIVAMEVDPCGGLPEIGTLLLSRRARGMRLLGLSSEGREGFLYEHGPNGMQIRMGEVSPERLLSAIRARATST